MNLFFDNKDWRYKFTVTERHLLNNFSEFKKTKKSFFNSEVVDYFAESKTTLESFLSSFFTKNIILKRLIKNVNIETDQTTWVFCFDFGKDKNFKKNEKEKTIKKISRSHV